MEIREAQELIRRAYFERDSRRGLYPTFTWLVEEVGELADSILKGDRKVKDGGACRRIRVAPISG
jgi:hypothetical protein